MPRVNRDDDASYEPGFLRNKFSPEEDAKLIHLVEAYKDAPHWRTIASKMNGKTARQCRERYGNYLNPKLKQSEWSRDEDEIILTYHEKFGNHWNKIASKLEGRTGNSVRNRWFILKRNSNRKKVSDSSSPESEEKITEKVEANLSQTESRDPSNDILMLFDIIKEHQTSSWLFDDLNTSGGVFPFI